MTIQFPKQTFFSGKNISSSTYFLEYSCIRPYCKGCAAVCVGEGWEVAHWLSTWLSRQWYISPGLEPNWAYLNHSGRCHCSPPPSQCDYAITLMATSSSQGWDQFINVDFAQRALSRVREGACLIGRTLVMHASRARTSLILRGSFK